MGDKRGTSEGGTRWEMVPSRGWNKVRSRGRRGPKKDAVRRGSRMDSLGGGDGERSKVRARQRGKKKKKKNTLRSVGRWVKKVWVGRRGRPRRGAAGKGGCWVFEFPVPMGIEMADSVGVRKSRWQFGLNFGGCRTSDGGGGPTHCCLGF